MKAPLGLRLGSRIGSGSKYSIVSEIRSERRADLKWLEFRVLLPCLESYKNNRDVEAGGFPKVQRSTAVVIFSTGTD